MYDLILWTVRKNIDPDMKVRFAHESTLETGIKKRNTFRQK